MFCRSKCFCTLPRLRLVFELVETVESLIFLTTLFSSVFNCCTSIHTLAFLGRDNENAWLNPSALLLVVGSSSRMELNLFHRECLNNGFLRAPVRQLRAPIQVLSKYPRKSSTAPSSSSNPAFKVTVPVTWWRATFADFSILFADF